MNYPQVVGLGAMNMDYFYRVQEIITEGEAPVTEFHSWPGGSAANTIYALAKLGVSTGFVGAVGDDPEGTKLIADLSGVGVDTGPIRVKSGFPSGRILALVDALGRRALYAMPGANNHLAPHDLDLAYINPPTAGQWLHLSAFVGQAQFQLQLNLVASLPPQVQLSLSPGALYARRGLRELAPLLSRVRCLFLNRTEVEQIGGGPLPKAAKACLNAGCAMVVVTLGADKKEVCRVYTARGEQKFPRRLPLVPVVDTTGAGDAFAAGFLFGLLRGKEMEQCAVMGEILAQECIKTLGARPGLPSLRELEQRLML